MPAFRYRALNPAGKLVRGVLEGDSERAVRQQLRTQSLRPVEVSAANRAPSRGEASEGMLGGLDRRRAVEVVVRLPACRVDLGRGEGFPRHRDPLRVGLVPQLELPVAHGGSVVVRHELRAPLHRHRIEANRPLHAPRGESLARHLAGPGLDRGRGAHRAVVQWCRTQYRSA